MTTLDEGTRSLGPRSTGLRSSRAAARPQLVAPAAVAGAVRRLVELGGLALMLGGLALLATVLSYQSSDPSWNTAVAGDGGAVPAGAGVVRNLLGRTGAELADLLMQTFGFGAYLLPALVIGWGWRVATHHGLPLAWARAGHGIAACLAAAVALEGLAGTAIAWSPGVHPGGSLGYLLLGRIDTVSGAWLDRWVIGAAAAAVAGATALGALRLSPFALVATGISWLRVAGRVGRRLGGATVAGAGGLVATGRVAAARLAAAIADRRRRAPAPAAAPTPDRAHWDGGDLAAHDVGGRAAMAFDREPAHSPTPAAARAAMEPTPAAPSVPAIVVTPAWEVSAPIWADPETAAGPVLPAPGAAVRVSEHGTRPDPAETPDDREVAHALTPHEVVAAAPAASVPTVVGAPVPAPWDGAAGTGAAATEDPAAADPGRALRPVVVGPAPKPLAPMRRTAEGRQPLLDLGFPEAQAYQLPAHDLLQLPLPSRRAGGLDEDGLRHNAEMLEKVLGDFGVRGTIQAVHPGPVVTLYELEPAPGTKSSRVIGLADDIARSMCAISVRVAVVPGRNVLGIELPNAKREIVYLRELLASEAYEKSSAKLALALGKDISGAPVIADLARFPHLLVAGTTGSGKSVAINAMILSLLYRLPPDRCRLVMIDPKMLELSVYEGIPHLLAPVVTDPKVAVRALKWTVREMENRYRAMSKLGVRNIEGYNARLREARQTGEALTRRVQTGFDPDTGKPLFEEQPVDLAELPYIVVLVDEMADLMLVAGKDIEAAIQRLAQMARAAGIHLIMATQRPSVDVITGTIKANFPTRISFQVTSKIDSRTILGEQGAEQLLGQGDMLYMAGGGRLTRVHGPFVRDDEVESVVRFLKTQGEPNYVDAVTDEADDDAGGAGDEGSGGGSGGPSSGDLQYDRAVDLVCREGKASTSFVQRHLRIGYNSAARLIERMEKEGVVSKANHAGKREVLARTAADEEAEGAGDEADA